MAAFRVLPVFLVLLQSGLASARAHTHAGPATHAEVPHVHPHAHFDSDHGNEGDHDGDDDRDGSDHDQDAVDLSGVAVSAVPSFAAAALTLHLAPAGLMPPFAGSAEPTFPVGLPPSTAGPQRPLYLTFCTLTI